MLFYDGWLRVCGRASTSEYGLQLCKYYRTKLLHKFITFDTIQIEHYTPTQRSNEKIIFL